MDGGKQKTYRGRYLLFILGCYTSGVALLALAAYRGSVEMAAVGVFCLVNVVILTIYGQGE